MLDNLNEAIDEYSKDPKNKMKTASRKSRRSSVQYVNEEWRSDMVWDASMNDTIESDENDSEEEEEEEESDAEC